ncbi:MAG TPA: hypothetical protein VFT50_03910 [Baekduia sp.]|nr:hypothetical protein [Baekduia sp.]
MRDLTFTDLDLAVAEQLPARELMGGCCSRSGSSSSTAVAGNSSYGLVNALNGNQIQILTFGSANGNGAYAG